MHGSTPLRFALPAAWVAGLLAAAPGLATQGYFQDYRALISASGSPAALGIGLFGEQHNLYSGKTEFVVTDVSLPGTGEAPVAVTRRYVVEPNKQTTKPFGDWELDLPRIRTVVTQGSGWTVPGGSPNNRCSQFDAPPTVSLGGTTFVPTEYWQGYQLLMPGDEPRELVRKSSTDPTVVTRDFWKIECVPLISGGAGEGFRATSPNGIEYTFARLVERSHYPLSRPGGALSVVELKEGEDLPAATEPYVGRWIALQRVEILLQLTQVTDRSGNVVTYSYTNSRLTGIHAEDGRSLSLEYNAAGQISAISDGTGRKWTYSYRPAGSTLPGSLHAVDLPGTGTGAWSMELQALGKMGWTYPASSNCTNLGTPIPSPVGSLWTASFEHPSGAQGDFDFEIKRHGRHSVSGQTCLNASGKNFAAHQVRLWDQLSLTRKEIVGSSSGDSGTWTIAYPSCSTVCPSTKAVTVTDPRGFRTVYTYGALISDNPAQGNEGQLQSITEGAVGSGTPLRAERFGYHLNGNGGLYSAVIGITAQDRGDRAPRIYQRPLASHLVCQQDQVFGLLIDDYDSYLGPTRFVRKRGNQQAAGSPIGCVIADLTTTLKTDTLTLDHNLSHWILGTPRKLVTTGGGFTNKTEYEHALDTLSRITSTKYFGESVASATYTYHANGTVHTARDALNQTTTLTNYERGIPQRIEYQDNSFITAVVNNRGELTQVTDEEGHTTSYGYDAVGRLTSIDLPDTSADITTAWSQSGGTWSAVQTVAGSPIRQTTTLYDTLLRPIRITQTGAGDRVRAFRYDIDGRTLFASYPAATSAAATKGVHSIYDGIGRISSQSADAEIGSNGLLTTTYEYQTGFKLKVTDPRNVVTTSEFYTLDRPTQAWPTLVTTTSASDGNRVNDIDRDLWGKPKSFTRNGVTRTYGYNSEQELVSITNPETGTTTYTYDAAGNRQTESIAGTLFATYDYDSRNRLIEIDYNATNTADITRTYFKNGWLKTASTTAPNASSWAYTYNPRGMVLTETLTLNAPATRTHVLTYVYNSRDQLTDLTYPDGGTVKYTPNAYGEPTEVRGASAGSALTTLLNGFSRNAAGQLTGFTYGNGIARTATYNVRQLPLSLSDEDVFAYGYSYDGNGNPTSIVDSLPLNQGGEGTRTLAYDNFNRLTSVNAPGLPWTSATYSYDHHDNLKTVKIGNGNVRTFAYVNQKLDAITQSGASTLSFSYDGRGNILGYGSKTFTYDGGNRLLELTRPGEEPWLPVVDRYTYDAHGRRTSSRWSPPGGGSIVQEDTVYSAAGLQLFGTGRSKYVQCGSSYVLRPFTVRYVYLGRKLIGSQETADCPSPSADVTTTRYHHTDALGSVVARSDDTGAITDRNRYEPYGKQVALTPLQVEPGFTGHNLDQSGLIYMQARYYDPDLGRFLAADPIGIAQGNGDAFNRFAYANNNPARFTDPTGMVGMDTADEFGLCQSGPCDLVHPPHDAIDKIGAAAFAVGLFLAPGAELYACVASGGCSAVAWGLALLDVAPGVGKLGKLEDVVDWAQVSEGADRALTLAEKADTARDFVAQAHRTGDRPGAFIASHDEATGAIAVGCSGGGFRCAENNVRSHLPNRIMGQAYGHRRNPDTLELDYVPIDVCHPCQKDFSPSDFQEGVTAKPGGAWENPE